MLPIKKTPRFTLVFSALISTLFVFSVAESCKSRSAKKPELECDADCQKAPPPVIAAPAIPDSCSSDTDLTRTDCMQTWRGKCSYGATSFPEKCQTVCSLINFEDTFCSELAATCPSDLSSPFCVSYCAEKKKTQPEIAECKEAVQPEEPEDPIITSDTASTETCASKYLSPNVCKAFWEMHCEETANKESDACKEFATAIATPAPPTPVEPVVTDCETDVTPETCANSRSQICHSTPTVTGCSTFLANACGPKGSPITGVKTCSYGGTCYFRNGPSTSYPEYFAANIGGTAYKAFTETSGATSGRVWVCVHIASTTGLTFAAGKEQAFKDNNYVAWFCDQNCL